MDEPALYLFFTHLWAASEVGAVATSQLSVILDYDLTVSVGAGTECHHLFAARPEFPAPFRADIAHLFAVMGDEHHADYARIVGPADAPDRPHRFWVVFNELVATHAITRGVVAAAVTAYKAEQGRLIRPGVAEFLELCHGLGVPVVILSAGVTQIIELAMAADGVRLPASCTVLANSMTFDGDGDGAPCIGVTPTDPPSSRVGKLAQLSALGGTLGSRACTLLVGDKPVDAKVAAGYPPLQGRGGLPAVLAFGFQNSEQARCSGGGGGQGAEYETAFHLLDPRGEREDSSFEPLTGLLRVIAGELIN
jgi:hypothetical protein